MVHTEFLILGQGISGTWLSYWLHQAGREFIVADDADPAASSRVAAGVINPVTGRRYAITWMADELLPFAEESYSKIGNKLSLQAISGKSIIDFFPTPQMRLAFLERLPETCHLSLCRDEKEFSEYLSYELGCGRIDPVFVVNLAELLASWRNLLATEGRLLGEKVDPLQLKITASGIRYKDFTARYIIYCDGYHGMEHPFFNKIPFAPNKGEAILAEIPGLPANAIYKKGMSIVPLDENDLFWVGASYEWDYAHADPTPEFKKRTESFLKDFLKLSFRILDHQSAIRPASLERRPFVGMHPKFSNVGILNGMGTKGCSLAPFFGKQLCDHLVHGTPIDPLADISRFKKILLQTLNP